jgi:hypothetical protein
MQTDSDGTAAASAASDQPAATTQDARRAESETKDDYGELKQAISAERKARNAAEKLLGEVQAKLTDLEGRDQTELEKTQTERDRLKADLAERDAKLETIAKRHALTAAATKAGARYPDLLVDRLLSSADLDADLNVTNADALVKQARGEYPDLFTVVSGRSDGGRTGESSDRTITPGYDRLRNAYAETSRSRS